MSAPAAAPPTSPWADRSRTDALAAAALTHYDVSEQASVSLLTVSENATYRVEDPQTGTSAVLRLNRPGYHSRAAIESELAWTAALRAEQVVRTPAVLPSRDGSRVVTARLPDGDTRQAVLFAFVGGAPPDDGDLVRVFGDLGALTARLHQHARSWDPPAAFTRFRWDVDDVLGEDARWGRWRDGLGVGPTEQALFARAAAEVARRLARLPADRSRFGLVHADMRAANLLVDPDDGAFHVIDFDDAGMGYYAWDLAASLSFMEHHPQLPEVVDAWLRGYRTEAPLGATEEAELATFIVMRRLLLVAWIGSHRETEQAQSCGAGYTEQSAALVERWLTDPAGLLR